MDMKKYDGIAYCMEESYRNTQVQRQAIDLVKKKFPEADSDILLAMWSAIDAYIDINAN